MMLSKAKEFLLSHSIGLSVTTVGGLLAIVLHHILAIAAPSIVSILPPPILLELFLVALLACGSLLVFLWLSSRSRSLRLRNGFFWDQRGNPHCPACKCPLTQYADYSHHLGGMGAKCVQCNQVLAFYDRSGKHTTKEAAHNDA